jgi:hypothetical protein
LVSVSADGKFIYFNLDLGIERYALPAFTLDQHMTGIGGTITALQVSPRFSHVLAAEDVFSPIEKAPYIFLDMSLLIAGNREPWDTLVWSTDGSHVYAGDSSDTGGDFVSAAFAPMSSTIVTLTSTPGIWSSGASMHLDAASGLIYADNNSKVIDPTVPKITSAVYPVSGVMAPDSTLGCAYLITQTQAQIDAAAGDWTLSCYSTADQNLKRSIVIPGVSGTPTKMLAIQTTTSIYFISGQIVTGN